jgi:hypothetical protein
MIQMASKSKCLVGDRGAPDFSPEEAKYLQEAFRCAFHLRSTGEDKPLSPAKLVFLVLRDAMQIMRALPDTDRARLKLRGPSWCGQVASPKDEETARSELVEFLTSETAMTVGRERRPIRAAPREVSVAEFVLTAFPRVIVGKNTVRDWKMLYRLASGVPGPSLALERGVKKQQIYADRDLQCTAIARRLADFMPREIRFHPFYTNDPSNRGG